VALYCSVQYWGVGLPLQFSAGSFIQKATLINQSSKSRSVSLFLAPLHLTSATGLGEGEGFLSLQDLADSLTYLSTYYLAREQPYIQAATRQAMLSLCSALAPLPSCTHTLGWQGRW
jgi:hypothetical protein